MHLATKTFSISLGILAMLAVLSVSHPSAAENKTTAQCGHEFDQCEKQCATEFKDDPTTRGPCVAKCSGIYAACDAGVAYEKARPWIEEQAKKTKRFFDDLLKEYGNKPAPAPEPQDKTKGNSIRG